MVALVTSTSKIQPRPKNVWIKNPLYAVAAQESFVTMELSNNSKNLYLSESNEIAKHK
jgi:hypothetical protein